MNPIGPFIVFALLCGLGLWVLSQFPTLDATVVKFIRVAILVVLSILLINRVLILLTGQGIGTYLGSSPMRVR